MIIRRAPMLQACRKPSSIPTKSSNSKTKHMPTALAKPIIHSPLYSEPLLHMQHTPTRPSIQVGPCLPETKTRQLDEKWVRWLSQFEPGSVVFCSFGSQSELKKDEFQELVLGFESCGLPSLVALKPPKGCSTVEEALPQGF
ncbi:hypothetical protein F3Y22_tig00110819pilonHSYRG00061 [Hibiscus syriacus]|uniref:Uncharacterized protein n=1 Tax=Hibiscus syriacus TaxID=106335 RepID=A0A6A2ZMK7_HIBSY|nr:hypothetical protein F3Y22_tig00110819pilonHSYRG00061 [Hibiscus syriacus]